MRQDLSKQRRSCVATLAQTRIPELLLSPSAEQGYYLFLYPLSPGKHTIRWVASGWQSQLESICGV
jgi:hypothetical protein